MSQPKPASAGETEQPSAHPARRSLPSSSRASLPRISIEDGNFMRDGEEVVLLGGNYVLKAQPYFPPADVVRTNAREFASGAEEMSYRPTDGRRVVPVVRLGVLFEGAMPADDGEIDPGFAARLGETIEAFAAEGVYVFLDAHQDALCTTNGGEGLPWWMTAKMQERAGVWNESYITSPEHPLKLAIPSFLEDLLKSGGLPVPSIELADASDPDPWRAYSVGGNAGNPAHMNVGNVNMRKNNNDKAWGQGTLILTAQVQNVARRLWNSHAWPQDRADFFEPYMTFIRFLCSAWKAHSNVVAVELFNEPPIGGLPNFILALSCRRDLFRFYGAVLAALDADPDPTQAPLAFEDLFGAVVGASPLMKLLEAFAPVDCEDAARLTQWAGRGQLVLSFHYYPGFATTLSLAEQVAQAQKEASLFGSPPIWLSEFFDGDSQATADTLVQASELGCGAVTYWQYADLNFTKTAGWYRYTPEIMSIGVPVGSAGEINWESWQLYAKTVADGSFWGANITGAEGAKMGVLALAPAASKASAPQRALKPDGAQAGSEASEGVSGAPPPPVLLGRVRAPAAGAPDADRKPLKVAL